MSLREMLSDYWYAFQQELFPRLESELGPMGERYELFVAVLELVRVEVSTAAGICTGAAAQNCTTGSVVACPRSPWEGPARGATRPPRGWRRPARGRMEWTPPTPDAGGREG